MIFAGELEVSLIDTDETGTAFADCADDISRNILTGRIIRRTEPNKTGTSSAFNNPLKIQSEVRSWQRFDHVELSPCHADTHCVHRVGRTSNDSSLALREAQEGGQENGLVPAGSWNDLICSD